MPSSCVVPGCKSNYKTSIKKEGYVRSFKFPKNDGLREEWIRAIPRANWTPNDRSIVCIKHFHDSDLIYVERYIDKTGKQCEFVLETPILSDSAVPKLFPGLPSYLSIKESVKRTSPEERRKDAEKRQKRAEEDEKREIEEENKVTCFEKVVNNVRSKVAAHSKEWHVHTTENVCILYKLDISSIPKVSTSIRINVDLTVEIHVDGAIIPNGSVLTGNKCIFNRSVMSEWKQLQAALDYCDNIHNFAKNNKNLLVDLIDNLLQNLKSVIENDVDDANEFSEKILKKLNMLHDQFIIMFLNKPKYNITTVLNAFLIYMQSVKCYQAIRFNDILTLPHPRVLQKLSAAFSISPNTEAETNNFLKNMVMGLSEQERIVNLQVDEIHVKQSLDFKNGKIFGVATNDAEKIAKTVVCFLVSSAFGSFKEVVRLVPVKQLKGSELTEMTKSVIRQIQVCGLKVLSVICDNNRVNRVMFSELTKESDSKYYFQVEGNPLKTFVLYDSVHVFKNIRNNWINLKNPNKTFCVPFWENLGTSTEIIDESNEYFSNTIDAKFSDIRDLYKKESNLLVKAAPKLNYKTLYPNNFERQKVSLVVNVFNDTTFSALQKYEYTGTAYFVNVILTWWYVVNIKRPLTHIFKNNEIQKPFSDIQDSRLVFLSNFLSWLLQWKHLAEQNSVPVCLTPDTFNALYHCTFVLKEILIYALSQVNVGISYVLPGKFQSDNLESRFGQYRQLAGGNYNITVTQILEAEKKIRIKHVLGLKSARYGSVTFSTNIIEFNEHDIIDSVAIPQYEKFSGVLEENYLENIEFDESGFLYICGYVSFKLAGRVNCTYCSEFLTNHETCQDEYFQLLNRGSLSVPSEIILLIGKHVVGIAQTLVSIKYESMFLTMYDQTGIVRHLSEIAVLKDDMISNNMRESCFCGNDRLGFVKKAIKTMSYIILRNYCKKRNESVSAHNNRRKLDILS